MKRFSAKKIVFLAFAVCVMSLSLHGVSHAANATTTWIATSTTATWNTAANWSTGKVPGATSTVLFSASSTKNCTINLAVTVAGFNIASTYTGVITQGTSTIVVGTSSFYEAAGTFTGGSGTMNVSSTFSVTGGTFTAPTGALTLAGQSDTFASSSFKNNSSTVIIDSTSTTLTGSSTFYILDFMNANPVASSGLPYTITTSTIATGTVISVQNTLDLATGTTCSYCEYPLFYGGEFAVSGNIVGSHQVNFVGRGGNYIVGTSTILLTGSAAQTISSVALTSKFQINKSGGTVAFVGQVDYPQSVTWQNISNTTMLPGTSTVYFVGTSTNANENLSLTGTALFNNLYIDCDQAPTIVTVSSTITVSGVLDDTGSCDNTGSGAIDVSGNIASARDPYIQGNTSSTMPITLTGTSTQTIGVADLYFSNVYPDTYVPGLLFANASDSVILQNTVHIPFYSNWVNTVGATIVPGTSTVQFQGNNGINVTSTATISGSSTFYNLYLFADYTNLLFTVPATTTITVQNNLMWGAGGGQSWMDMLGGGTIDVAGNIIGMDGQGSSEDQGGFGTQSGTIVLNGTSTQIIDATSSIYSDNQSNTLFEPWNLVINKPSGLAVIQGDNCSGNCDDGGGLIVDNNLTIQQGELQVSGGEDGNQQQMYVYGTLTINSGARFSDYPTNAQSNVIGLGASVVNNGTVFLDGGSLQCGATISDDIWLVTDTTNTTWTGSGNYVIRYVLVNNQEGSVTAYNSNNYGSSSNWTFTSGPYVELVQTASSSGGSGTSNLTIPFTFYPRAGDLVMVAVSARNQAITAPTDTATNTYYLVASSTFGASNAYGLSLYYAKNVTTTSSFSVTVNGGGGTGQMLSAAIFEYEGVTPTSSFDVYSSNTGTNTVSLTSNTATASSTSDLFFGAATLDASTTLLSGSGWTATTSITNNVTNQALYTENVLSSPSQNTAATWTAGTSTNYAAILATFKIPLAAGYAATGTLDSQTFDTGVTSGVQLNSFLWQGSQPASTTVQFQFAVSNSTSGPWNYEGPDGTANTYFSPSNGISTNFVSTNNGYALFNGYRYFRYRTTLGSTNTSYTPSVTQVIVNWSP